MPPRIRTLKPDIWQDRHLGRLPVGARLLFIGIITQADDEGRFRAELPLLRAAIFPFDDVIAGDSGSLPGLFAELDIAGWLGLLEQAGRTSERPGLIRLYEVRGERFGDLPTWSMHQRIDSPKPSKLPSVRQADKPVHRERSATKENSPRTGEEQTGVFAAHSATHPGSLALEGDREGDREETHVDPQAARPRRLDIDLVWGTYQDRHPTAKLTNPRRELIKRRLVDYDVDTLNAAIEGNHLDPHCNGENDRGQTYHGLELILRDAEHVERYSAIAQESRNGHTGNGESRLARAQRLAAEREATR
jgi:hypothetical protein